MLILTVSFRMTKTHLYLMKHTTLPQHNCSFNTLDVINAADCGHCELAVSCSYSLLSCTGVWVCRTLYAFCFYCASYALRGICHGHVSMCLCLSQVGVLLKWLNIGTRKQPRMIAQDSSFLLPKIFSKFDRGHPNVGTKCRWGRSKLANFDK